MLKAPEKIGTLDDYLARICVAIQLNETQFTTAVKRYKAVGGHLDLPPEN